MVASFTSGVPRQFMAMCENSRCSILFHLLVPARSGDQATRSTVSGEWLAKTAIFQPALVF